MYFPSQCVSCLFQALMQQLQKTENFQKPKRTIGTFMFGRASIPQHFMQSSSLALSTSAYVSDHCYCWLDFIHFYIIIIRKGIGNASRDPRQSQRVTSHLQLVSLQNRCTGWGLPTFLFSRSLQGEIQVSTGLLASTWSPWQLQLMF